jgi:hypothetical protein
MSNKLNSEKVPSTFSDSPVFMVHHLIRRRTMGKLWLFLFALLIPPLTGCVQVEVSLSGDNAAIVDVGKYSLGREEVDTTAICPLRTPLASNKQNTGVWCWAASAQMVINYLQAVNGEESLVSQCTIVNVALAVDPAADLNCCNAEDSYDPTMTELGNPAFTQIRARCQKRFNPLMALQANQYDAQEASPLEWEGLTDQFCTKKTPYIFVVRFYDDDGSFAGAHSSVVGGARVTPDGDRYVEVSDHSEDDFFLMKWEAFKAGVRGDFDHVRDYIDIKRRPS